MEITGGRRDSHEDALRALNELTGWENIEKAKRPPDIESKRNKK